MTRQPVSRRKTKPAVPPPIKTLQAKARRLPMPGPGIPVPVPLHLLLEYLELYSLQANGIREPKVKPKDGPGEAILLVKRIQKEEGHGNNNHIDG